ncbi:MAG: hypothetical protein ACOCUV_01575 [bacterium]
MEIYIELTPKQLKSMENGKLNIPFPEDVTLTREKGSRACYLHSEDDTLFGLVEEKLDELGWSWQ